MDKLKPLPMRLAIREVNGVVSAYLASPNDMRDAMLIGSIAAGLAHNEPDLFERWKAVMVEALNRGIVAVTGQKPTMVEQPAPEHERQT